ncbi:MAG TPA: aminotransferase class I/II-fold pyridoxal phosphate-dependent enzyme, partial [Pirellulales bacterium]|nr:aminotransferase class I/II-fold pyridoxal phosphate-dependent enzyme [Pirellulales bacterium]
DGDLAPLAELSALAERYGAMLLVDEAHATGVFGQRGRGLAEALDVEHSIHIRVGTLSKALGSAGGFVCGKASLIDWLVNRARSYIFSTAAPPSLCAAGTAALAIVGDQADHRGELLSRARNLRQQLREDGWQTGASNSQIIPLVVGEAAEAVRLSRRLAERGFLVPAMRPPSVPAGESLLRISLSYAHTAAMLAQLRMELAELRPPRLA